MITDSIGRKFESLRISLTEVCNFSCVYCVDEENSGERGRKTQALDTPAIVNQVMKIHRQSPLKVVRLTGGEPLLFKQLGLLINEISSLGIEVKITTNGVLLKPRLKELVNAGLKSINVSFDAAEAFLFNKITRSARYHQVINGIEAALEAGVEVKLNAVIIKGVNDNQVIPLLELAGRYKIVIRFLELMDMGHLYKSHHEKLFTEKEILESIRKEYFVFPLERAPSSTAKYWVTNQLTMFGIISNHSDPFCYDCNRLRLDSHGNIYGCLSSNIGLPITGASDAELREKLRIALQQKKEAFTGSSISMKYIGG